MKRSWIGFGLLLILLLSGIFSTWRMQRCQEPMAEDIRRAGELAATGDWEEAQRLALQAQEEWESCWGISAALTDHGPMESADALFDQLEVYASLREPVGYAAVCAQLGSELEAIGEAHGFVWWNLL